MAITSLFGPTPAQIEQARQLQMDQQISGEGAELGPFRGLYQASRRLGSAGTQSLVSGLFPEAADPAMRQAQAVQLVQQKYQGQNLSDPSVLKSIASDLFNAGAPDAGLRILKTAQDIAPKQESIFGKIDPKDYTPESVAAFSRTRDYSSLVAKDKPNAKYRELTQAEIRARGLDPNRTYQLEEGTNKVSQIGQGPAVVFNAPLLASEGEYAKNVGKSRAERDVQQFGAAEAAVENLPKINEILNELNTGQAFTGSFSELQKNIQKVQAKFAADKKAGKRVSDTEYLDALLGSDVFPMIGALGIGARGLDTPAEREFLRKVMSGEISLEKDTLIRMTELRKKVAERAVNKFNTRVDKGELNDFFKFQGTQPQRFEIPKFEPPAPVPSATPTAPQQGGGWSIKKVQ